jgi:hypothetical protein
MKQGQLRAGKVTTTMVFQDCTRPRGAGACRGVSVLTRESTRDNPRPLLALVVNSQRHAVLSIEQK